MALATNSGVSKTYSEQEILEYKGIEANKSGGYFKSEKLGNFKKKRSDKKEHFDFVNAITDAKTKWTTVVTAIIEALLTVL